jgi:hypothetical protein
LPARGVQQLFDHSRLNRLPPLVISNAPARLKTNSENAR